MPSGEEGGYEQLHYLRVAIMSVSRTEASPIGETLVGNAASIIERLRAGHIEERLRVKHRLAPRAGDDVGAVPVAVQILEPRSADLT